MSRRWRHQAQKKVLSQLQGETIEAMASRLIRLASETGATQMKVSYLGKAVWCLKQSDKWLEAETCSIQRSHIATSPDEIAFALVEAAECAVKQTAGETRAEGYVLRARKLVEGNPKWKEMIEGNIEKRGLAGFPPSSQAKPILAGP